MVESDEYSGMERDDEPYAEFVKFQADEIGELARSLGMPVVHVMRDVPRSEIKRAVETEYPDLASLRGE